jgi:hypothetical protein
MGLVEKAISDTAPALHLGKGLSLPKGMPNLKLLGILTRLWTEKRIKVWVRDGRWRRRRRRLHQGRHRGCDAGLFEDGGVGCGGEKELGSKERVGAGFKSSPRVTRTALFPSPPALIVARGCPRPEQITNPRYGHRSSSGGRGYGKISRALGPKKA